MYVRLAFAVAAHLEPEILLVDEVLAVGDAAFQKKCLGKMGEVAETGRTVLFVSHNMSSINALSNSAILLADGRLDSIGPVQEVVASYLATPLQARTPRLASKYEESSLPICILGASTTDENGTLRSSFDLAEAVRVNVDYRVLTDHKGLVLSLILRRQNTDLFLAFDTDQWPERLESREAGVHSCSAIVHPGFLKPGRYSISLSSGVLNQRTLQRLEDLLTFDVTANAADTSRLGYAGWRRGVVRAPLTWEDSSHKGGTALDVVGQ